MYDDIYYDVTPASNEHRSDAIWRNFGAQYMRDIEQYKGTPYYEMLLNNPYLSNGTEFTPSWWTKNVRELFGDYSESDNFYAGRNQQAQEYMSQIINSMTADKLNSPLAKVARDNAAGINSDLVGVQAPDSTASGVSPDEVPPTYPENSGTKAFDAGMQLATLGSNFVKGIMEFGSMFMDMRLKKANLEGSEIANAMSDLTATKSAYDMVLEVLASSGHFQKKEDGSIEVSPVDDSLYDTLQDSLVDAFGDGAHTERAKKLLRQLRGRVKYDKDGKPTLAYQTKRAEFVARYLQNHQQAALIGGSKGFDDNIMTYIQNIAKYFTDLDYELYQAQNRAAKKVAKYQEDKYGYSSEGETLGTAEAKADIESFRARAVREEQDAALDKQFKAIEDFLKTECKGTWFGAFGLLLLPFARRLTISFLDQSGSLIGAGIKAIGAQ